MLLSPHLAPAFATLALAVLLLWVPAPAVRGNRDWAWCAGLLVACVAALASGVLDWRGVVATAGYVALALDHRQSDEGLGAGQVDPAALQHVLVFQGHRRGHGTLAVVIGLAHSLD